MLIAHLSDPHVIEWSGLSSVRFLGKRATGWANFHLRRAAAHPRHVIEALLDDIAESGAEHVIVSGDVSSLAFGQEMELFGKMLAARGLGPRQVSIVPGNHDAYTRKAAQSGRFMSVLGQYTTSDLHHGNPAMPFVRIRGDTAIVGLSTAVARPVFMANGLVGSKQASRLVALLKHPEVRDRLPVVVLHHPPLPYPHFFKELQSGLLDRQRFLAALEAGLGQRPVVVLCGHWHCRRATPLPAPLKGTVVQSSSGSRMGGGPERWAAYHLLGVARHGNRRVALQTLRARGYHPDQEAVVPLDTGGAR